MKEFNTQVNEYFYTIKFTTDDRKAYEQVQRLSRLLLDGKEDEVIPIEWIKEWTMKNWVRTRNPDWDIVTSKMIEDWKEENAKID